MYINMKQIYKSDRYMPHIISDHYVAKLGGSIIIILYLTQMYKEAISGIIETFILAPIKCKYLHSYDVIIILRSPWHNYTLASVSAVYYSRL